MSTARAVLFDLDGVLVNGWHTRPEKRVPWTVTIEEDLGIKPESLKGIFFGGLFEEDVLTGRRTLEEVLSDALPKCGFHGRVQDFIDYWMAHDANINLPLFDIVKKLKATGQVRLFIASNNEKTRMDYFWETVGLKNYFDDMFYAGDFGVLKPDLRFFQLCDQRMGDLGPCKPLFFDDSPVYCQAASQHGWEAVVCDDIEDCFTHPFVAGLLQ